MNTPNRNYLWTRTFVEELARCGLKAVCIAPGSRSTPLAIAFHEHPDIESPIHLDERSAAFFALGMAQAWDAPVALVCTSGTAAAEFFPAIVEARQANIPLLVLTTDRPPELRYSGANQTVDQVKLYGDQVLWSVEAPLPEAAPSALVLRSLRTLAARALAKADGIEKGPVHINFPYRMPLEPTFVETDITELPARATARDNHAFVQISRGVMAPTPEQLGTLYALLNEHERGVIVCGPRCPGGYFPDVISALARRVHYPILAEPLSGLRFHENQEQAAIIGGYENFPLPKNPELILQFGAVPTSKTLNTYLDQAGARRIMIKGDGVWSDDTHDLSDFLHADPGLTCHILLEHLSQRQSCDWENEWQSAEAEWWSYLDSVLPRAEFDGGVLHDVVDCLPDDGLLFVGNSLPVRHLEEFARPTSKNVRVMGNRGASGIDGVVSSALGAGMALGKRVVLVIGDISFYHDMNGLLAIKKFNIPATIVLLNNDGGGIFQRLPIAQFDPPFRDLFLTPHGLDFAPAAQLYGLDYQQVTDRAAFRAAFTESFAQEGAVIVEYTSDVGQDSLIRQQIKQRKS
jgi:2-succinyl-5-enolpyruvyl-6-hydroxy-3-cyclohexene-1-carboxylate synthase